ncbi:MAG: hypothetical protein ACRCXB_03305 [Aeromonadaceae bacterium]
MNISKSKKELARIISENGGWCDGLFAVMCSDGTVLNSQNKPFYDVRHGWCCGGGFGDIRFVSGDIAKNWCHTILSSKEYFHLYPAPDADGWIEWNGEPKSPVDKGTLVDVKMKGGTCHEAQILDDENWGHYWGDGDIISYRLHKQEQYIGELCDKVTEENKHEHVDAKPTIEQLAADYRNRKDYADRKQQEADAAKADAEAKLAELVAAGEEIGLVVSVADVEPELVITDWRDLQLGDIIEYVDGDIKDKTGMTGPVVEFAPDATDGMHVRLKCDNGPNKGRFGWPRKWRFIRRP